MTIRLLIADPQPVTRAGLTAFFSGSDVEVVDVAETAEQLVAKTLSVAPDVVVLDATFPDGSGFDAVQELRKARFAGRVVFFLASDRSPDVARAAAVGADARLLKTASQTEIVSLVRELALSASPETAQELSGELRRVRRLMRLRQVDPLSPLTARETQVLRHITLGLSNKEIAFSLKLSVDTVKEHVQNILRKLEVNDRAQAAVWAVRNKLVP